MFGANMAAVSRTCQLLRGVASCARQQRIVGSLIGPQSAGRQYSSQSQPSVGPVYELRIYSIKPEKFADFRQLMAEKFYLRLVYSNPLGYWITDLGGIFQAVHIWPYDSVSHRAEVRHAMAVNEEWQTGFFSQVLPCMHKMDNAVLVTAPGTSLCTSFEPSDTAAYELLTLPLQPGSEGVEKAPPSSPTLSDKETLVGTFRTVYGDVNTEYRLLRYPDADTAFVRARKRTEENPQMAGYSRFMVPHECSPLK